MQNNPNTSKQFAALQARYIKRMMLLVPECQQIIVCIQSSDDEPVMDELLTNIHQLAGSAEVFGFKSLSKLALAAEKNILSAIEHDLSDSSKLALIESLQAIIDEIHTFTR